MEKGQNLENLENLEDQLPKPEGMVDKFYPQGKDFDTSQLSLNISGKPQDFSDFQEVSQVEIVENRTPRPGIEGEDKSLDLKYTPFVANPPISEVEYLKHSKVQEEGKEPVVGDSKEEVQSVSKSPSQGYPEEVEIYSKEEEYSKFQNDNIDTHTLIYNDTSTASKNFSDMGNRSGVRIGRYDSDEDNPYDESKSDLFNPMMYTRE